MAAFHVLRPPDEAVVGVTESTALNDFVAFVPQPISFNARRLLRIFRAHRTVIMLRYLVRNKEKNL